MNYFTMYNPPKKNVACTGAIHQIIRKLIHSFMTFATRTLSID